MHALIDLGSTNSYICTEHVFDRMPSVEQLPYDMLVTSPLGHSVRVNCVTPPTRYMVSGEGVFFFFHVYYKLVHSYTVKHLT